MNSNTALNADAISARAGGAECPAVRQPDRRRPEHRRGALFMMAVASSLTLGGNVGCMVRVDDCVAWLRFEYASSGEPVANACVEFATQGSLGGLSPDEFLDSNATFRTMTTASGGVSVRMSISNRFLEKATHGVVDPIWIARIHLPDRTETIVFQRNYQYSDSDDIIFLDVGEFVGSMGETVLVTNVGMVGCGSAVVPPNEGCTDEP